MREAARANAVFEAVIVPVVKDCVWGEIERKDGVLTGFSKGLAEQYLVKHWGGVKKAWLVIYTDDEAEKAAEWARKMESRVAEKKYGERS